MTIFAWLNRNGRANSASHDTTRTLFSDHVGQSPYNAAPMLRLRAVEPGAPGEILYTRDSFAAACAAHWTANPNLALSTWCAHTGGLPTRVMYDPDARYVIILTEPFLRQEVGGRPYGDFRNKLVMADDGGPKYFDCAHCATVEMARLAADIGTLAGLQCTGSVYTVLPGYTDLSNYLPPPPEVVGEPYMPGSSTNKDVADADIPATSCGNCGRVSHNARTCTKPPKAHDRIGIEIEGRWLDLAAARSQASRLGLTGCGDGSVNHSSHSSASPYEFQTVPGTVSKAIEQLVAMYPDEADRSCGMHVHVSFESLMDVTLLCTPAFFSYFKARWTAWGDKMNIWGKGENGEDPRGEFWKRLEGDNDYCQVNHNTPNGNITRMDRYHQLNFSAWSEHKTIECRLLPMFRKASLAVAAVKELVDIFEDFLANTEAHGLVSPAEDVTLPVPALTPVVKEYTVEDELLAAFVPATLNLDMADVSTLAPTAGTIRTFRGTVLAGATLSSILANNGISIREAA